MKLHVHPRQLELLAQLRRQGHPLDPRVLAGLELEVDPVCPPEHGYLTSELLEVRPLDPAAGLLPRPRPGTQLQTYARVTSQVGQEQAQAYQVAVDAAVEATRELEAKLAAARWPAIARREAAARAKYLFEPPPPSAAAEALQREMWDMEAWAYRSATIDISNESFFAVDRSPLLPTPEQLAEASDPATPPERLAQLLGEAHQAPVRHRALANERLPGEVLRRHLGAGAVWAWLNPSAWLEAGGLTAKRLEYGTREAVLNILSRYWADPGPIYHWRLDPLTTTATLLRRARVATRSRLGGGRSSDGLTADQARAIVEAVALVVGAL